MLDEHQILHSPFCHWLYLESGPSRIFVLTSEDIYEELNRACEKSFPNQQMSKVALIEHFDMEFERVYTTNCGFPNMEGGNLAWLNDPAALACELFMSVHDYAILLIIHLGMTCAYSLVQRLFPRGSQRNLPNNQCRFICMLFANLSLYLKVYSIFFNVFRRPSLDTKEFQPSILLCPDISLITHEICIKTPGCTFLLALQIIVTEWACC